MKRSHALAMAGLVAALAASSCTSHPTGAHPHDMGADEHRDRARTEDAKAAGHEAQYDPTAEREGVSDSPQDPFSFEIKTYNPTGKHLDDSAEHRDHAAAHREAADKLEQYEKHECAKFPPKTRSASPLLGQVASVEKVDDGVSITPAKGVNRQAMLAHMRCHVAYAATRGFEGMDTCPLYVKGVSIVESDGQILLKASDPAGITAVQKRTAAHVK